MATRIGTISPGLADEYSSGTPYSAGDIVMYGNKYWKRKTTASQGEEWTEGNWDDVSDIFAYFGSKSYIDGIAAYPLNTTSTIKDRAINVTSASSVTLPSDFTDLMINANVTDSLSVSVAGTGITTTYGDTFPGKTGKFLVTITRISNTEAYVKTIELEEQES